MSQDHPQETEANDVEASKALQDSSLTTLHLSDIERQILDLHDRLEELQLELAYLQAQTSISQSSEDQSDVDEQTIQSAQVGLLEAKAHYNLRNNITESVMIANPILKAVHASLNANAIERDLLPLIQERDDLSVALTERSSKVLSTSEQLTLLEAEHVRVAQKNKELATTMIELAEEANTQRKDDITDPETRVQLDDLQEALKISRQRWRIMKGTASAVVAGSGIDWARDRALRELVLDNETDET